MTQRPKRFPRSLRFGAVFLALVATASLALPAVANPPSAQQVQNAKDHVAALARAVKQKEATYADIAQKANAVADQLAAEQGKLEQLNASLLHTQLDLAKARAKYDATVTQLNDRARQAFMQGPGSNFEFLLGATSLLDLSDRIEYVNVVAQSDVDLATQVQNTKNDLSTKEANLRKLTTAQQAVVADVRAKNAKVEGWLSRMAQIVSQIRNEKASAEAYASKLSKAYQAYIATQFASGTYGGGHQGVALPSGYSSPFQVCPVDQPRAYGDGFGAPRYAGGYHLHMGVDIMAPMGTPIRATFDGYTTEDPNGLGGNAVEVHGASGWTYNAHLSAYSAQSTGTVHAGDIIGYVGNTGDAAGGPTHDHFEYHPNSIPAGWPASAYGYSVIDGAINPYPLLVAICT
ncbi:MAG: murein hydrolase activator EnvC family protein [Actinomycetota bacterium]